MVDMNLLKSEDATSGQPQRTVSFKGETLNVPEAFWDAEGNCPNVGALVKSHSDLRRKLSESRDRDVLVSVPDVYDLVLPEELSGQIAIDVDDLLAKGAMDWARKHGLGQEAFSELSALYYGKLAEGLKDSQKNREGELSKLNAALGSRSERDIHDLSCWIDGLLGDDLVDAPELVDVLDQLTSTADGVVLLKKLKDRSGERGVPSSRLGMATHLNEDSLRELQASESYRLGDKATCRKVAEGWARLYPDNKN